MMDNDRAKENEYNKVLASVDRLVSIIKDDAVMIDNAKYLICIAQLGEILNKNKDWIIYNSEATCLIKARHSIVHEMSRDMNEVSELLEDALCFIDRTRNAGDIIKGIREESFINLGYHELVTELKNKLPGMYKYLLKMSNIPNVKRFDNERNYLIFSDGILSEYGSIENINKLLFEKIGGKAYFRLISIMEEDVDRSTLSICKLKSKKITVCKIEDVYTGGIIKADDIEEIRSI